MPSSVRRRWTRLSISSRIGRTTSTDCPAGSASSRLGKFRCGPVWLRTRRQQQTVVDSARCSSVVSPSLQAPRHGCLPLAATGVIGRTLRGARSELLPLN